MGSFLLHPTLIQLICISVCFRSVFAAPSLAPKDHGIVAENGIDGGDSSVFTAPNSIINSTWFVPLLAVFSAALLTIIIIVVCWCIRLRLTDKRKSYAADASSRANNAVKVSTGFLPIITTSSTPVQPSISKFYDDGNKSCMAFSTSMPPSNSNMVHVTPQLTSAPRLRHKGLLESRGAARLTLSLSPSTESLHPSPTHERRDELSFLATAGRRLSRADLARAVCDEQSLFREFWQIPMHYASKLELPEVQGIAGKNRYQTIIPNADTRVILPELFGQSPASSYINANFIRGYGGCPRAFIATQGPLEETVADLWRMVWLSRVPAIVMITDLVEKKRAKCALYFPLDVGETLCVCPEMGLTLSVLDAEQHDGWTIRHLLLCQNSSSQAALRHRVAHYWYPLWPDHTTPSTARKLLALVEAVSPFVAGGSSGTPLGGPVLVHCSAGLGRTGAFCALCLGVEQLRRERACDPLRTVCQLRLDRGGMVQTHEQYEFLHRALHLYAKDYLPP